MMFTTWLFYIGAQTVTLLIFKPFVNKDMLESIGNSHLVTMHHLFRLRNEYFPFLSSKSIYIDADSKALAELITLYHPKLDLSETPTNNEIHIFRHHAKHLLSSLYSSRSSSCVVQYHKFQYNTTELGMYYIQHGYINDWKTSNQPVILYFHGGGFVFGDINTYAGYECDLSKYLNMLIVHVELPLLPEHSFEEVIKYVIDIYQFLHSIDPTIHRRLIGMGDSSGGMLWIYLLQWIVSQNQPVPQGVVLHSPWPHLNFSEDDLFDYNDQILSVKLVLNLRQLIIGKNIYWLQLTDEQINKISPKKDAFEGFPPIYITAGTAETLINEIRQLTRNINLIGGEAIIDEGIGLMHNYALFSTWTAKAKCVQESIRKWIRVQLFMYMESTLNKTEITNNSEHIR